MGSRNGSALWNLAWAFLFGGAFTLPLAWRDLGRLVVSRPSAFLGERLGWEELVGFVLISAGLTLVSGTRAQAAEEPDAAGAAV